MNFLWTAERKLYDDYFFKKIKKQFWLLQFLDKYDSISL